MGLVWSGLRTNGLLDEQVIGDCPALDQEREHSPPRINTTSSVIISFSEALKWPFLFLLTLGGDGWKKRQPGSRISLVIVASKYCETEERSSWHLGNCSSVPEDWSGKVLTRHRGFWRADFFGGRTKLKLVPCRKRRNAIFFNYMCLPLPLLLRL